jgi:hypothetical protein
MPSRHTAAKHAGQSLLDCLMNVDHQAKPGMPWIENSVIIERAVRGIIGQMASV